MHVARPSSEFDVPVDGRKLGKYELVAKIGSGGMAEVHLARLCGPMGFQKVVVLKTIHGHLAAQQQFLTMLFDEARISALLKHPRVVDIYDLGEVDGTYFIAMEHLVGEPLSRVMFASASDEGPTLDVHSMARIIADTADGLAAAHDLTSMAGEPLELVHRDMSPGNVVVLYDGNVKIVDFGIAKARGRLTESGLHSLKGKAGYMSPEQIEGAPVDRRSDVFALGVVLWESIALQRLFHADTDLATYKKVLADAVPPPSTFRPDAPSELDAICLRAVARDPADRYQTAADMRDAIERFLARAGRTGRERIETFMRTRFSGRRDARDRAIRRLAVAADAAGAEDDYADIIIDSADDASTPLSGATGSDATSSAGDQLGTPPRPRSGWPALLAATAMALAIAGAGLYYADAGAPVEEPASRTRASKRASPPQAKPPARAAPEPAALAAPEPAAVAAPEPPVAAPEPPALAAAPETDSEPPPAANAEGAARRNAAPVSAKPAPPAADRPDLGPNEATAAANRYYIGGDLARAKDLFKRVIRTSPRYAPAHRGLGLVYEKLGRKPSALRSFRTYLKLAPEAADANLIRNRIEKLGD